MAQACEGQVALTFGLALLPLVLAIGCAVDISRAMAAKSRLLETLDATGLAVARSASADQAEMTSRAHAYFYANFAGENLGTVATLNVTNLRGNKGIRLSATTRVATAFMSIAGYNEVEVAAEAEIMRETRALELVMVLDTTASMTGSKISSLRSAARALVDMVLVDDSVKVGIVPFERYVNIGMGNRSAPGVSVPADTRTCEIRNRQVQTCTGSETYETTCSRQINPRPGTCEVDGAQIPCTVYDEETYPCTRTRGTGCTITTEPHEVCTVVSWRGCVGSRLPPLNASDEEFSTPLVGVMNINCGSPMTMLTNSVSMLRASVGALRASGNTYIPAGLQMGWHALTPRIPFTQATAYSAELQPRRAMLLMTDGTNSVSLNSMGAGGDVMLHDGTDRTAADQLTRELCTRIKADGIEIYTVAFQIADMDTKDMIRECASSPDTFFDASNASKLLEAFASIAAGLSQLRVSK